MSSRVELVNSLSLEMLCRVSGCRRLERALRLFYISLHSQAPQQQYLVHCMHYGITLWAYLFEQLVKDSHKHLSSTEKPQYRVFKSLDQALLLRMCYGEIYTETLQMKKMADL